MASKTVIDQLIVTLGLDPKDFDRGRKKAAAGMLDLEKDTQQSANSMSSAISGVIGKYLALGAVVVGLKKAWNLVSDTATATRQLGLNARNFGLAANELRNFENAIELAGGKAENAESSIAGFQKAIFDLAFNGQISDSLVMLARLGVQFQDSTGHARNFKDIMLDTAGALEDAQAKGQMTKSEAFQYALSAGFDSGTANLLMQGRAGVQADLATVGAQRQVGEKDTARAEAADRSRINRDQSLEAGKIIAMNFAGGFVEGANNLVSHMAKLAEGQEKLTDAVDNFTGLFKSTSIHAVSATARPNPTNPGNIRPVGATKGFQEYANQDEGIRALNRDLDIKAKHGLNTVRKIISKYAPPNENDTEAYIRKVSGSVGVDPDQALTGRNRVSLVTAMLRHETPKAGITQGQVYKALAGDAQPTPNGVAGNGGGRTSVQIDQIKVYTAATDASGIASDIDGEMQRKLLASYGTGQGQL